MKVKLGILLLFIFSNCLLSGIKLKYNFSYFIKGSAKGHVLFIIPFRVFYQASASVDFSAEKDKGKYKFSSVDISKPGYMIRTLGFSGRSVALLAAHKNREKGKIFSKQLLNNFNSVITGFGKYVKKKYYNLFMIPALTKNTIFFSGSEDGVLVSPHSGLQLKRTNPGRIMKINFNIYKIMMEVIKAYNHSFLPHGSNLSGLSRMKNKTWFSRDIDFSGILTRSARLAARVFAKIGYLDQERSFRVKYTIVRSDSDILSIRGESFPDVKIWRNIKIRSYSRDIIIRKKDLVLIRDSFYVEVVDKKGRGGFFKATLKLDS